jgi:glutathione S-transferase
MDVRKIHHLSHVKTHHTLEDSLRNLKRQEERNMYTLYYSPFACSLAVHIALEKIDTDFELDKVDVRQGQHKTEAYLKINKHGKVPLLKDGDQLIDEGAAILLYLAEKHPEANILPLVNTKQRGKALSALFYMSNTVHPAFSIAFNPERFTISATTNEVLQSAKKKIERLLEEFDQQMAEQNFISGNNVYAADYYLLAMLNWLQLFQVTLNAYPRLLTYKQRMDDLPEVTRAQSKEMADI